MLKTAYNARGFLHRGSLFLYTPVMNSTILLDTTLKEQHY